jgi:HemY protein
VFFPSRVYAYTQKLRPEKGLKALTQSVISTALEEYESGRSESYRFERYLGDNPVHKGLLAYNYMLEGKLDEARKVCETMKSEDDARTLSWVIEAKIALKDGKESIAQSFLQNLFKLHDKSPWVIRELLKCSLKLNLYDVSLEVLKKVERLGTINTQAIRQCRALVYFYQAEKESVDLEQKEELLELGHRLAPELVKAAVYYSKVLRLLDKSRRAKKAIEQSWTVSPHSDLLEEYLAIDHETDPKAIMKTANKLVSYNEQQPESYLAIAKFALKVGEWSRARAALHDYQEKYEMTQEACYLMARLELSQHADQTRYREWMEMALNASKKDVCTFGMESVLANL